MFKYAEPLFGGGNRSLILRQVDPLPLALFNSGADLGRSLALLRLFIGIDRLTHADPASGAVRAGKTILQALVALASVAMAIARLLVENPLDPCGQDVRILYHHVGELTRTESFGKLAFRGVTMECWNRFINALGQARGGTRSRDHPRQNRSA